MSVIHVNESVIVREKADAIFPLFIDFSNWHKWSPWFISDPSTSITISEDGKTLEYGGLAIKEGVLKVTSHIENQSIEINFTSEHIKKAIVVIQFESRGAETSVSWDYKENVTLIKSRGNEKRRKEISFDFKRGLLILSDLIHTGTFNSKIKMLGIQWGFGYDYVGINHSASIDELQELVIKDYKKLIAYTQMEDTGGKPVSFVIYLPPAR